MRVICPVLLGIVATLQVAEPLKFLVYNPAIGTSHYTFISKCSKALIDAGHEVVMLSPLFDERIKTVETSGARLINVPVKEEVKDIMSAMSQRVVEMFWTYKSDLDFVEIMENLNWGLLLQCNMTLSQPGLLESLRKEKFDAAFGEPIDMCGFAIFHMVGIEKTAMMLSVASTDATFEVTGAPTTPSYVPGALAGYSDRMSFLQRTMNTVGLCLMYTHLNIQRGRFDTSIQQFNPDMPLLEHIMVNTSLFFSNGNPLMDFPKVTSHKIIDVGGITVSGEKKPLNAEWNRTLSLRPRTMLISFGSAAQSFMMPKAYKEGLKEAMRRISDVTFIWKYEIPEHNISAGIDNIVESTWVPQRDLLRDGRLTAFLTHGGAGSITETTHAGVPVVIVPLMGDQLRGAAVIERLCTGVRMQKEHLNDADAIEKIFREVLDNPSYVMRSRKVAQELADQPFSPREKLVGHMEFMAKHGPLRQLDHYGAKLYFFQYYLIDVWAFLVSCIFIVSYIIYRICKLILCLGIRKMKVKTE